MNVREDLATDRLVERLSRLYPAVVADCLDAVGVRDHVMAPRIRPLDRDARFAGVARTLRLQSVDGPPVDPALNYATEIAAVDSVDVGDVLVFSATTHSIWGELLATAATARGAAGVVVDGYTRDSLRLIEMGFATFCAGISCYDSLGRVEVAELEVPVACGDVLVEPGDLLLGDHDGVVVVPRGVSELVLDLAEAKVRTEQQMRGDLADGLTVNDAFRRYGVL